METINSFIPLAGLLTACFSIWKYFDQRKREYEITRFDQFQTVMNLASGRTKEGQTITDVQQAASILQLGNFKEFRHQILPILDYWISKSEGETESLFKNCLCITKERIRCRGRDCVH
jgi:hypothetical protein